MTKDAVYHEKMRLLQDRFGTRRLADVLAKNNRRYAFTDDDVAFIERLPSFMLATADADGAPDCSYKGAEAGHMRVTGPASLSFPALDGNGMYRSLGNILDNPAVGLLFIDFTAPQRLRVNGKARVEFGDPRMAEIPGAEAMVHVEEAAIFSNCPRYIQTERGVSDYFDTGDGAPRTPDWKRRPEFAAELPKGRK